MMSDSQKAHEAWTKKFGKPQVELERHEPEPFVAIRRLGGGGAGTVYETRLDGIALALKCTYTRRLHEHALNEVKILAQLPGQRHQHIVELIGSFVHRQRCGYEIGLLIYPVAHCDLATFLEDMDALKAWMDYKKTDYDTKNSETTTAKNNAISAYQTLAAFWKDVPSSSSYSMTLEEMTGLYNALQRRLCTNFTCMASAVAYLHRHKVRHKDIKPSQFLLSPTGLWLTDFGWSADMSNVAHSATSNHDNITFRYHAPEREMGGSCSRREDVFSLGCTFLEMAIRLSQSPAETTQKWQSRTGERWSFQANLNEIGHWLRPFRHAPDRRAPYLATIIQEMMEQNPESRPTIEQVMESLSIEEFNVKSGEYELGTFASPCCPPIAGICALGFTRLRDREESYDNSTDSKTNGEPSLTASQRPNSQTPSDLTQRSLAPPGGSWTSFPDVNVYYWICCCCQACNSYEYDAGCPTCNNHWREACCSVFSPR
ncbi:kinase-like domain-containing protein [Paraphoma chrysanthemicola]|uniref:Kinase-like domain-containing protein n=1 Tax=Paraphoma chrysanthemicola TaxID=798071 RepID=A0A8K0R0N6_9PLEO|nr:kinase-like domain-containing protein [Paraphoma chrysanthemicola]